MGRQRERDRERDTKNQLVLIVLLLFLLVVLVLVLFLKTDEFQLLYYFYSLYSLCDVYAIRLVLVLVWFSLVRGRINVVQYGKKLGNQCRRPSLEVQLNQIFFNEFHYKLGKLKEILFSGKKVDAK